MDARRPRHLKGDLSVFRRCFKFQGSNKFSLTTERASDQSIMAMNGRLWCSPLRSTLCFSEHRGLSYTLVRPFHVSSVWSAKKKKQKGQEVEEKLLLGRPSNNLRIGVVGMPNIGKSSLFNALTSSSVAAENYPFCTIGTYIG